MKLARFTWLLVIFCSFAGCMQLEDESMTLSFWTDKEVAEDGYKMVFINDVYLGGLVEDIENPECGDLGLLNYKMEKSEDLHISIYNTEGDAVDIGYVNLYSVSKGIKIKPNENSEIFVERSLDDKCTLVYLNWVK